MRWWRAYASSRRDPKLRQLSDRQFRVWYDLLCLAAEYNGEMPVADLTHQLTGRSDHTLRIIGELIEHGLFTYGGGLLIPHNWYGRQYRSDSAAERMRNYRARKQRAKVVSIKRYDVTVPEKKESKKEREREKKWLADLDARLNPETQTTNVTSLRRLKPLGKWKG